MDEWVGWMMGRGGAEGGEVLGPGKGVSGRAVDRSTSTSTIILHRYHRTNFCPVQPRVCCRVR